jgi:hypothetical protein
MKPNNQLREQIARAESTEEVNSLLAKGSTFTEVSEKTRRRWNTTAKKRVAFLGTKKANHVKKAA